MDMTFDAALGIAHEASDKLAAFACRLARPHLRLDGWAEIPVPQNHHASVDILVRAWVEAEQQGLGQLIFSYRANASLYEQIAGKEALATLIELGMLHRLVNGGMHPHSVELMLGLLEWAEMVDMARTAWSERKIHFETLNLVPLK